MAKSVKYLITGGTGFLGEALVERLYDSADLRILARDEGNLLKLKQKFPKIEILTGDVSDARSVRDACQGIAGIFHLAAFKHIIWAESQVRECINTNVSGSSNILRYGSESNIDFILGISTDKAAQVNSVYGATKFLMERMFTFFEKKCPNIKYRIVRYGNVLYSTGSVLCLWKDALLNGKEIMITDPDATRFFWTCKQAVDLIFECLDKAKDCTPYCPEMKSMSMGNILEAMQLKYGKAVKINQIGLQKGENLHEKIQESGPYSNEVKQFSIEEIMGLI